MKVVNKTTGIIEYQGTPENFAGLAAIDIFMEEGKDAVRKGHEYEITYSDAERNELMVGDQMPVELGFLSCRLWSLGEVKLSHASALLMLTNNSTPEERDTWPSKALYAATHSGAVIAAEKHNETAAAADKINIVDGYGLSDIQKSNVTQALLEGETISGYLAKTTAKVHAFETLAFFAEGFKRKTELAIEGCSTVEEISAVVDAAKNSMNQAIADFKLSLSGAQEVLV